MDRINNKVNMGIENLHDMYDHSYHMHHGDFYIFFTRAWYCTLQSGFILII